MEMNERKESHDLQAPSSNMLRTRWGAQVTKHHEILARKLGTAIPPNELGNAKFPRMLGILQRGRTALLDPIQPFSPKELKSESRPPSPTAGGPPVTMLGRALKNTDCSWGALALVFHRHYTHPHTHTAFKHPLCATGSGTFPTFFDAR